MTNEKEILQYMNDLEADDHHAKEAARQHLINAGPEAVPHLVNMLKHDKDDCRWEAAKLLGQIRDEAAADALVETLMDGNISVHWAASEALISMGHDAILPLLKGVTRHFDSFRFRQGAYHILHMLEQFHQLDPKAQDVLEALRNVEPSMSAPWAAERAIEAMEISKA